MVHQRGCYIKPVSCSSQLAIFHRSPFFHTMAAPTSIPLFPADTLVDEPKSLGKTTSSEKTSAQPASDLESVEPKISTLTKYLLLAMFCLAQFLDAFNVSALFSAIPALTEALKINASEATWLISAFQLTFASFLLVVCYILCP
jgi:uncharacterized membrane protein